MTTKEKITIWTQSDTPQGIVAAKLAVAYGYEYQFNDISTTHSWKELRDIVPKFRTLPQIFVGTKLVGGLDAMMAELNIDPKNLI